LSTGNSEEEKVQSLKEIITGGRVDGVILMYSSSVADEALNLIQKLKTLAVIVGKPLNQREMLYVDNDNVDASYRVTDNLIKKGHKKIAFMSGSFRFVVFLDRLDGYAKALNSGMVEDEAKRKKYLQYICDKAESMTKLIDDLFEYAKLDSGKYRLIREKYDFAEFIRELIAANFIEISNKGFQLKLDIPESSVTYEFDRNKMQRAVLNILSNCLKYNPAGTTIGISVRKEDDGIVLIINDNGIGISQELKNKIFKEFVRGNAARQSDGGSGLGLTITKCIIEMHGGRIEITGGTGEGSTFLIYLPIDL
jgi:signal transduction histidine kinase